MTSQKIITLANGTVKLKHLVLLLTAISLLFGIIITISGQIEGGADKVVAVHNTNAESHGDIRKQVYSNSALLNEVAQNAKVQTEILRRMEVDIKEIKNGG